MEMNGSSVSFNVEIAFTRLFRVKEDINFDYTKSSAAIIGASNALVLASRGYSKISKLLGTVFDKFIIVSLLI